MKSIRIFKVVLFGMVLSSTASLSALDMSIRLTPEVLVPVASLKDESTGSKIIEKPAFGAYMNFDFNLFDMFAVGPEFTFKYIQKNGDPSFLMDFGGGLNVSAFFYPMSRLMVQGGLGTGFHYSQYKYAGLLDSTGKNYITGKEPDTYAITNMYMRLFVDAAFRINPNISVGGSIGYSNFFFDKFSFTDSFLSGIDLGLSVKYNFSTNKISKRVSGDVNQDEPIFPVYANIYKENGFAYANITNNESAEIRNVKISFRAEGYTASLYPCGEIPLIRRNKSAEVPLLADFSNEIASFTEEGAIPGEIIIEYTLLGKPMKATETVILDVHNRNSMRWADPAVLAMFVSPNATEVLEASKYIVGIARDSLRSGLNRNMQFATWIVEAINTMGIDWVQGAMTPYAGYHFDMESVDTVQYPFQTLTYHSGDADDLAVLVAALMQSVGIETSFIPLSEDFVVCLSLKTSESGANTLVSNPENLIIYEDEAWLPLSMKNLKLGFNGAWKAALKAIAEEEFGAEMIILSDAWKNYPPMGISGKATFEKANPVDLKKRADGEVAKYIANELQPRIKAQLSEVNSNPSEKNLNTLGLLYVRTGDYRLAKDAYNRSVKLGSVSAMTNLANIALLEKDYNSAKSWYEKVLEKNPDHSGAKKGLERIANEQGN